VNVIIDQAPRPQPSCNCHGHSSYCSPDGGCQNCQHNTAGYNCEFCAPGYQGNARTGTPYDCQPIIQQPTSNCNPSGTYTQRNGRCVCKYNVEGDVCNQCKRSHFYLNPTTPNGCLPCFCSGVSSDCTSTSWLRQALPLSLNNWNAVPKNFATDLYEAGNSIKQLNGGREISLDQSSLGRSANEVLYWKAPKQVLGDVVTLYDGNIDVHFTNDASNNQVASDSEFLWLRGNNIDLVHKIPATQQFKANTNATYSVPVNERTFTRKDGTYIDRENILMALSDLDTLLIKINPIGGRKTAVLRGVTFNVAARDGYADAAPTVESCSCPANYTGTSCEKCAEGYGRPHPLVGIYLGQCWSCQSLCHQRSSQCDRETGKCSNCQGNSQGDRCEQCISGYVLNEQTNQCVPAGQYQQRPPSGPGTQGGYYIGQQPYDPRGGAPLNIELDGSRQEQRIPLQVLNVQPQSVVWGRTDGSVLPPNVYQDGNDLVLRNPSPDQAGNYVCTITHPDGSVEYINVQLNYQPGSAKPHIGSPPRVSIQPRLINLKEGQRMIVEYSVSSHEQITVVWNKLVNGVYQPIPSLFTVEPNRLILNSATPDAAGTYQVVVSNSHGSDRQELTINVEPRRLRQRGQPSIRFQQDQYQVGQGETVDIVPSIAGKSGATITWTKDGSTNLPNGVTAGSDGFLRIEGLSSNVAGQYNLDVSNSYGQATKAIYVQWKDSSFNRFYRYQRART
jgi:heparan sulfate proteoglycan 2 (perlecan)